MDKALKYDVIVCTFNGASFISSQLKSILSQPILPQKIIVSDDGSCDGTLSIVKIPLLMLILLLITLCKVLEKE